MSSVWSGTWRFIGIGAQSSSTQSTGLFKFSQFICTISRLNKVQCLHQYRPFCARLDLPTLHKKPSYGPNTLQSLSTHQDTQESHSRYAHSLSGAHSRSSKSRRPATAHKREPRRPKQFDFPNREIQLIFQGTLGRKKGNQLLQTLQNQRVSGTLDEKVDAQPRDVFTALEWLRLKFHVDEDQAIIARLEREEREDDAKAAKITTYTPQWDAHKTGLYNPSRFDELRKLNKQRAAERAAQLEKALLLEAPGTKEIEAQSRGGRALTTPKKPDWVVRYREAATMQGKMPPSMSKFERLWPSALVAIAVLGFSTVVALYYIPPSRRTRLWPDLPPAAATLFTLIGINTAILIAWKIPPFWKFMNRTFILAAAYPHARAIVGAMFSHQEIKHFALNMLLLWLVGTRLHDDVGRGVFLGILLSCGAMGMFTSLATSVLRNNLATSTLGASGCVLGIIATGCILHSDRKLNFPFLPDEVARWISLPAILAALIAFDIVGLRRARFGPHGWSKIDHASHVGGHATGILAALAIKRRARNRKEEDEMQRKVMKIVDSLEKK